MITLWVLLAGSAGAVIRFVVDGLVRARWATTFPVATVAINVSGSLVLGLLTGYVDVRSGTTEWAKIAGVGFCGGYTTFSSASVETVRLLQQRRYLLGVSNGVITAGLSVAAAAAGMLIMS